MQGFQFLMSCGVIFMGLSALATVEEEHHMPAPHHSAAHRAEFKNKLESLFGLGKMPHVAKQKVVECEDEEESNTDFVESEEGPKSYVQILKEKPRRQGIRRPTLRRCR